MFTLLAGLEQRTDEIKTLVTSDSLLVFAVVAGFWVGVVVGADGGGVEVV